MRRKHRIDLYNDLPIDREINDVLASAGGRKQEILRTLLRHGYLALKGQGVQLEGVSDLMAAEVAAIARQPTTSVRPQATARQLKADGDSETIAAQPEVASEKKGSKVDSNDLLDHNPALDNIDDQEAMEDEFVDPLRLLGDF